MLQGQRDLRMVGRLILTELAPLVGIQRGVFYLADLDDDRADAHAPRDLSPPADPSRRRRDPRSARACSASAPRTAGGSTCATCPADYATIRSALGGATPRVDRAPADPLRGRDAGRHRARLDRGAERDPPRLPRPARARASASSSSTITANMRAEELVQEQAARAEAEAGLARLRQVVDVMPEGDPHRRRGRSRLPQQRGRGRDHGHRPRVGQPRRRAARRRRRAPRRRRAYGRASTRWPGPCSTARSSAASSSSSPTRSPARTCRSSSTARR